MITLVITIKLFCVHNQYLLMVFSKTVIGRENIEKRIFWKNKCSTTWHIRLNKRQVIKHDKKDKIPQKVQDKKYLISIEKNMR